MCQINIQATVKMFYILENQSFTWLCQPPYNNHRTYVLIKVNDL